MHLYKNKNSHGFDSSNVDDWLCAGGGPPQIPSALDAPTVPPCMHMQEAAQQSYQAAQGVEQLNCALPESPEWQRLVLLAMQDVSLDSECMKAINGVLEVLLQHTAKNSGCHQLM